MTRVYFNLIQATHCLCPQEDSGSGSSSVLSDRQGDKRIFFDDIFGSVSYEPEEKLPVSNCTCSKYLWFHDINIILIFTSYVIQSQMLYCSYDRWHSIPDIHTCRTVYVRLEYSWFIYIYILLWRNIFHVI